MRINCVSCGHKIELDNAYDDYEGQIKCWICSAILEIKTRKGNIKSARLDRTASASSAEVAAEGSA